MATTRRPHPLVPLSAEEINVARGVVAGCHDRSTALVFRTIELQEPARADLVPFLAAEHFGTLAESTRRPPRLAKVQYNFKTGQLSEYAESIVDIELGKEVRRRAFPHGTAPSISMSAQALVLELPAMLCFALGQFGLTERCASVTCARLTEPTS